MALVWGAWEVFEHLDQAKDDVEQLVQDIWNQVKIPVEMIYNDYKIVTWAWHHPIQGGLAVIGGTLWGAVILKNMPGDFAYIGPIMGAFTGGWGMFWLSNKLAGTPPVDWQLVQTVNGVSGPIADFTSLLRWEQWVGLRPWESNTSFLVGATLGWLIAPDFPMSAVALLGGIGGVIAGYNLLSGSGPLQNPSQPAPMN